MWKVSVSARNVNAGRVRVVAMGDAPVKVTRVLGVYDADGTVLGELSYFVRARFGRAHCELCDITHGRLRERRDWREQRPRLPVPVAVYHRDDQPETARLAGGSSPPVVLVETNDGRCTALLSRSDVEACAGSPRRLVDAIVEGVSRRGLRW